MQEHILGVGDELVIEGVARLTILAVEVGEVLLGITGSELNEVGGPEDRQRPLRTTARPVPSASDD
jgi:hypothetical protein